MQPSWTPQEPVGRGELGSAWTRDWQWSYITTYRQVGQAPHPPFNQCAPWTDRAQGRGQAALQCVPSGPYMASDRGSQPCGGCFWNPPRGSPLPPAWDLTRGSFASFGVGGYVGTKDEKSLCLNLQNRETRPREGWSWDVRDQALGASRVGLTVHCVCLSYVVETTPFKLKK